MAKKRKRNTQQTNRSADATIKGYIYQFNDTILRLLGCTPAQSVLIEGIEDVDIESGNTCEAIQCKYLPSKKYSLASIRDPILPMLDDFLDRIDNGHQADTLSIVCSL